MEVFKSAITDLKPTGILFLLYDGKLTDKAYDKLKTEIESSFGIIRPALKWTSELPTQEGWYWWKMINGTVKKCVEVSLSSAGQLVVNDGDEVISLPTYGGQWYGPIEPPE